MAIYVSPGSKSSPGFCHIRRQGKRSAQKQIICPTYRGSAPSEPQTLGLKTTFLSESRVKSVAQGVTPYSPLDSFMELGFTGQINALPVPGFEPGNSGQSGYPAARASNDFGSAADIMKSEMRGTISDLNREPLNTP